MYYLKRSYTYEKLYPKIGFSHCDAGGARGIGELAEFCDGGG
jgi:hypothetical protein